MPSCTSGRSRMHQKTQPSAVAVVSCPAIKSVKSSSRSSWSLIGPPSSSRPPTSIERTSSPRRPPGAPVSDGREDLPVHLAPVANEAAPGSHRAEPARPRADRDHGRAGAVNEGEKAEDREPQAIPLRVVVDAEHCPQDHLERDALHCVLEREGTSDWPLRHDLVGNLADDSAVDVHAVAVEGREHEVTFAEMACPIEHEERMLPEDRLEEPRVRLAGNHRLVVGCEEVTDRLRIAQDDSGWHAEEPHGEAGSVAASTALEKSKRPAHEVPGLYGAGHPWTWWQRGVSAARSRAPDLRGGLRSELVRLGLHHRRALPFTRRARAPDRSWRTSRPS